MSITVKQLTTKAKLEFAWQTLNLNLNGVVKHSFKLITRPFNASLNWLAEKSLQRQLLDYNSKLAKSKFVKSQELRKQALSKLQAEKQEMFSNFDYLSVTKKRWDQDKKNRLSKIKAKAGRLGGKKSKKNLTK